jgi:molecular chaperone GrpE (heat shock protein)
MVRKNEKAALMRKRNIKIASGGNRPATLDRRLLRHGTLTRGLVLCFVLLALLGFGTSAQAQDKSWSKKVTIDLTETPAKAVQYRSDDKQPQDKTELEFKGNNQDWNLLTFDHLPENLALKVNGKIDGYEDSEEIKAGRYYPFRTRLPLVLEIKAGENMPLKIEYWLGSWTTGPVQSAMKEPSSTVNEARKFADVSSNVKQNVGPQTLSFFWNAPVTLANPSPNASPSPSATPIPTPEFSWMVYLIDENPVIGLIVLIAGLIALIVFIVYGVPIILGGLSGLRRLGKKKPSAPTQPHSSPLDSLAGGSGPQDTQEGTTKRAEEAKHRPITYDRDKDRAAQNQTPQVDLPPRHAPGDVIMPPTKLSPATSFNQPAPLSQTTTPTFKADGSRLEEVENKLARLKDTLEEKANRHEQERLLADVTADLENKLRRSEDKLDQRLKAVIEQLESMGLEQASLMENTRAELNNRVNEADLRGVQAKDQLVALLEGVLEDVKSVDSRLQASLSGLRDALRMQTVPDSFFNKTLGLVLGQNVETLQDGNFERLIGEKLNQFFETGVEHGESLQELRVRAEGINLALKAVSIQMEKLNPQGSVEARQPIQQFEAFVHELSGLQTQMQSRRATIETTVHVPVSMHPGARQTFLDELGRGIRRQIDKLNDPQKYFDGDMERLITTDLVSIVDICDKTVAPPPGSRAELETALKQLFAQAGLRQILPRQGEAFKTAEQDLIEMAPGTGQSLTVAQVITRGFYYKHRDNETLLRKAGVSVYR